METANTAHKIFKNTIGQIILRGVDVILGIVTIGLITRYLGQEGFGYYTTAHAFLQLFITIIDFGLYLTLLREISARPENETERITNNIFTLRLVSALLLLALACGIVFFSPYPTPIRFGVIALSGSYLFSSLISTLTAIFQKYLYMVRMAAVSACTRTFMLILTAWVINSNMGLQSVLWASTISIGFSFAVVWYLLRILPRPIHLKLRFDMPYAREILRKTWPIAITITLNLIYFKADTIILSIFQNQESVGLYGASYRVVEIITTFPHMFMGLILPILTTAWIVHDRDRVESIWRKTFTLFAFFVLPMISGTFAVGNQLMVLIAGKEFSLSGSILKVLILAIAAIFFGVLYTYMVLVVDKQKCMVKYFAATAAIALLGYLILIPLYSFWGAAWMTVASEILIVASAWFVVRKEIQLPIPWITVGKLTIASCIMAAGALALMPYVHLILIILISAGIYFILSIALRAVTIDDIRQLIKSG